MPSDFPSDRLQDIKVKLKGIFSFDRRRISCIASYKSIHKITSQEVVTKDKETTRQIPLNFFGYTAKKADFSKKKADILYFFGPSF